MRAPPRARDQPPRAKKRLGQHFLADRRVLAQIVAAAAVTESDHVVEVGPGRGVLTAALLDVARSVTAVELDETLVERLSETFGDRGTFDLVSADARDVPLQSLVPEGREYKVVANLPYYAAMPIIRRFLEAEHSPSIMVVLVQREVGRAMAASPGEMSMVSIAVQLYGCARVVGSVSPRAFRPPPKVTSAIVRVDVYPTPALDVSSIERFFTLARAGFSAPRKQVHNSLQHALSLPAPDVEQMLRQAGIDGKRRAQTLALEEWGRLYSAWETASADSSSA